MSIPHSDGQTAMQVEHYSVQSFELPQLCRSRTDMRGLDTDLDLIDKEFARYCGCETRIQADHAPVPERVPTPDSLRRKLDTLRLKPEDVEHLALPKDYPILDSTSDTEKTKFWASEISDDFRRRLQVLDDRILEQRCTLTSCPSEDGPRSAALHALASSLRERYQDMLFDIADLKESIERGREALAFHLTDDPSRLLMLMNLSVCLQWQFTESGKHSDLNEAVELGEQSLNLALTVPLRCEAAGQLAWTYTTRCEYSLLRQLGDLDRACQLSLMAIESTPSGDKARYFPLIALANCHRCKIVIAGDTQENDQVLRLVEEALTVGPSRENQGWQSRYWMGLSLRDRFDHSGQPHDLELATIFFQESLALFPFQPYARHGLAACLLDRYSMFLQHNDFDSAIDNCLYVLQFRSIPTFARLHYLNRLGFAFGLKCDSYRGISDIDNAIAYYRSATRLHSLSFEQYIQLASCLCDLLSDRFAATENAQDLEEASALQQKILSLQPSDTIKDVRVLANLAQAIDHGSQRHSWVLPLTLAVTYLARFQDSGSTEHLHEARRLYHTAADTSSKVVSEVFMIILRWIREMNSAHFHDEAFNAYKEAILLLPRIAYLGYDSRSRLQVLARTSTLSGDAAACALTLGRLSEAAECLEAGRAVFWSHLLRMRHPLDGLPLQLSSRLLEIYNADSITPGSDQTVNRLFDRRRLNGEFNSLVAQARLLPGFEDFFKPRSFASLAQVAKHGPVVVLVASTVYGCGALIIKSEMACPVHIALADVTVGSLQHHSVRLSRVNRQAREILRHMKPKAEHESTSSHGEYGRILATLWINVVKPIIDALALKKLSLGFRPRVWWCLTGQFAFLPIHAAGLYGKVTDCTSDYMISSYTSTLDALITARQSTPTPKNVLLVAEPYAPGQAPLPQTALEIDIIAKSLPRDIQCVLKGNVSSREETNIATVDWTANTLPGFSIAHLACHGHQDQKNPLQSGFYLRDGNLTLEKLMKLKLPNAVFAFLSACESATGDRERPDEAIHLAAAMLFAGFRSVVATMWAMDDADGPVVAHEVYKELFKTYPVIDLDAIPRALDSAVRKLREKNVPFSRWATYVHMGC